MDGCPVSSDTPTVEGANFNVGGRGNRNRNRRYIQRTRAAVLAGAKARETQEQDTLQTKGANSDQGRTPWKHGARHRKVTRAQSTKHKGPRETLKRAEKQNDRNGTTKKKQTRHREGKRGSSTGATRNGVPELQKALPPCTKSTQGGQKLGITPRDKTPQELS